MRGDGCAKDGGGNPLQLARDARGMRPCLCRRALGNRRTDRGGFRRTARIQKNPGKAWMKRNALQLTAERRDAPVTVDGA
jgi:hypothetical protein